MTASSSPQTDRPRLRPGPTLPGTRRTPHPPPYRDPDDPRRPPTNHATLRARILLQLVEGPQSKAQLHRALLVAESVIYRQLTILRTHGVVKVVGRRLLVRQWALAPWQPPAETIAAPPTLQTVIAPKPVEKPATCSWWAQPFTTRDEFYAAHEARGRERQWARENTRRANGSDR